MKRIFKKNNWYIKIFFFKLKKSLKRSCSVILFKNLSMILVMKSKNEIIIQMKINEKYRDVLPLNSVIE